MSVFRMKDRRQVKPKSFVLVGFMLGMCAANPISLLAQAQVGLSAWMQPPVVMSLVGVILSVGMAWQMVTDDRRRLTNLEANTVLRETFVETMKRIDGSLEELKKQRRSERHAQ